MTLLFMDAAQGGDVSKYKAGSTGTLAAASPRFAGGAYWTTASLAKTIAGSSEVFAGAAFNQPSGVAAPMLAFASDTGATVHVVLVRNTSLHLEARLGSTSGAVLATGTATLTASTWAQVEARVVISDTVGVIQVRINGSSTPDISFSGDTRNGGTSTNIDEVTWSALNSAHSVTDAYVLNASGTVNNSWLGDRRVVALSPTSQGFYAQGVRNPAGAASTNWSAVDELPFVGGSGSDRVSLATTKLDSYLFSDLPAGTPSVAGLQANYFVCKDNTNPQTVQRLIRSASTNYLGTATSVTTTIYSFVTLSEVVELDPATSVAWAPAAVDALELGLSAFASATNLVYMSGVSVEALILSFPPLVVTIPITSSVRVDVPNEVVVGSVSYVTVHAVPESAGPITVLSTSGVTVGELTTDYPRPTPADPTLITADPDVEPVIQRRSETYPDPTLVNGVPVDWQPV